MAKSIKDIEDKVVFLFGKSPELPKPDPLNVDHLFAAEEKPASREAGLDLTGKPKVLFLIGAGATGKTTFARWVGERARQKPGGGGPMYLITVDPIKRDLLLHCPDAFQPKANSTIADVVGFLQDAFERLAEFKRSAAIDFGGGDTTLLALLVQTGDLHTALEDSGIEAVALHFLSPDTDGLAPLVAMERAGFKPRATALLLNEGRTDQLRNSDDQFVRVRSHPDYARAIERGAVEVRFPRLHGAEAIKARRIGFWAAIDRTSGANLNMFEHRQVRRWLERMEDCMQPIMSWLEP